MALTFDPSGTGKGSASCPQSRARGVPQQQQQGAPQQMSSEGTSGPAALVPRTLEGG